MNRTILLLLLAALTGVLAACIPPRIAPEVMRRYRSHSYATTDSALVRVSAFSLPIPPAAGSGIASLAERGQAELIRAVATRTENPAALTQALGLPIRAERPTPGIRDLTLLRKRLVLSVENQSMRPADRVSWTRIRIRLPGGSRFVSWDKLASEYLTVDLGKLTYTRGSSNTAELGFTLPVLDAAPKVSSTAESSLQEETAFRQRLVSYSGALTPQEAVILQQGATGIDLTGNLAVDVEVAVPRGREPRVFLASVPMRAGLPDCQKQPALRTQVLLVPSSDSIPIQADVVLEYLLRRVERGGETIMEGDDSVTFVSGRHVLPGVSIIPREDLSVAVFRLHSGTAPLHIVEGDAGADPNRARALEMASVDEAEALLAWLRRCGGRLAGYQLLLGGRRLRPGDLGAMYVWREQMN